MLLSDAFIATINDHELYFLALACHYHDLAMAGTEADDQTVEGRDQVRRDHAIRIGQIVCKRWAELGFENPREAEVLGEVCRGHRPHRNAEGEVDWEDIDAHAILGVGVCVRLRLLSAMVYAADELHLGADRAPERIERWREIKEEEARRHWRRHQATHGPASPRPGVLSYQINVETPGFEENMRSQVFQKALRAVQALRRQAETEGVTAALPTLELQWNRRVLWGTLLPAARGSETTNSERDRAGWVRWLPRSCQRSNRPDRLV